MPTLIRNRVPARKGLALILFGPAEQPPTVPEFDVEASLATAGWLDVDTRDQLVAALREKPAAPTSPFYN